jgi:peptidylprolyl isomerase
MSTQTERPSSGDAAKRRGQAFAGALAGVAIVVVLAVVFFVVRHDDSDKSTAAAPVASQAPATPEAGAPSEAAPQQTAPSPANVKTPPALAKEPAVTAGKGALSKLGVTVLIPGTGPVVKAGQTITVNYKLVSYKTGEVLDSSWSRKQPFSTQIGVGAVIPGFDQGVPGQKVGSRFQLDIPAALAYGEEKGDLRFVIDMLAAQ